MVHVVIIFVLSSTSTLGGCFLSIKLAYSLGSSIMLQQFSPSLYEYSSGHATMFALESGSFSELTKAF